ncbi:MAG: hypothetical protein RIM99_04910 [Cyclobacteriaceae bacterium]
MPKTEVNIHDLRETDFRDIQKLLLKKYGKEYTTGYIRKVCKGNRHNTNIKAMAEGYLNVRMEMKSKIEKLSN